MTSSPLSQNFISEIRSAGNKEAEKVRVDKELGKIRKKFAATKDLSGMFLLQILPWVVVRSLAIFAPPLLQSSAFIAVSQEAILSIGKARAGR